MDGPLQYCVHIFFQKAKSFKTKQSISSFSQYWRINKYKNGNTYLSNNSETIEYFVKSLVKKYGFQNILTFFSLNFDIFCLGLINL